ncbi:MAG: ABC transporter permease subunit [Clostridium chrysemydis]|uniref:ABC transporter permease subunit n=1 Tax=Clostridium chrysemydis TaxID=2665504 RepID=UPI003F2EBF21
MLFRLIINELKKIFKRPKTWVVFALFFAFILGLNIISYKSAKNWEENSKVENRIKSEQDYLAHEKNNLKENENNLKNSTDNKDKEFYKSEVERLKQSVINIEDTIKSLEKEKNNPPKTWQEEVKIEKKELTNRLEELKRQENNIYTKREEITLKREIENKDYYLNNNIKPVDRFGFSIGENFGVISTLLGLGILAAGIAVFASDIVSGECTPPTFKFLLVQPISRSKVILSKYISIVLTTVILIIGTQLLITVLGVGLIDGFDTLKSMVFVDQRYEFIKQGAETMLMPIETTGEYITYGAFLLRGFAMQTLFVIAVTSFVFMISSLFKSSMMSMAVSVVVGVLGSATMSIPYINKFANLNFLSYGDVASVMTGEINQMHYITNILPQTGISVMIVTIIVTYLIAHTRFVKRDILV